MLQPSGMIRFSIALMAATSCLLVRSCTATITYFNIKELMEKHAKSRPQNHHPEQPLRVYVGLYLESIGNFRSQEMAFDVDLYVYMSWLDTRLAHNRSKHVLINDDSIRKLLWLPDLYFANARQAHFEDVTVPNFNLFISNDGMVSYSCRATCTISCTLQLQNYPMDRQRCSIRLLSYAHVSSEVDVHWFTRDPIRYNPDIGLPEFTITNVTQGYCDGTYHYAVTEESDCIGTFSCLTANIHLSRSIGYNLVQSYIPTSLVVMISWVSFWIDRRAVPARVTLSFTALVSLTTLGSGLRFGLPQVSYAKAIDFWFGGACMFFVICALVEYALVNTYMRKADKFEQLAKDMEATKTPGRKNALKSQIRTRAESSDEESTFSRLRDTINGTLANAKKRRGYQPVENGSIARRENNTSTFAGNSASTHSQMAMISLNGTSDSWPAGSTSTFFNKRMTGVSSFYENFPHLLREDTTSISDVEVTEDIFASLYMHEDEKSLQARPEQNNQEIKSRKSSSDKLFKAIAAAANPVASTTAFYYRISRMNSRVALRIDKSCRLLFPILFFLFNFAYWWYYLVHQNESTV